MAVKNADAVTCSTSLRADPLSTAIFKFVLYCYLVKFFFFSLSILYYRFGEIKLCVCENFN